MLLKICVFLEPYCTRFNIFFCSFIGKIFRRQEEETTEKSRRIELTEAIEGPLLDRWTVDGNRG